MAASIIDALVITLGLDTSDYDKKRKDVGEGLKDAREDASKTAKEMESQGKRAASFFSSIKTELLALAGVSLTIGGLTAFVKSTTNGLMDLSIQSKALGISAQSLDGWAKAAEAAGSSAEKITGTLGNFQNAIQAFKSGDASSPVIKALALLNADTGTTFDVSKQNPEELLRGVSGALQKEKSPDRARTIAQMMGIDDATLQAMRAGTFVGSADKYAKSSGVSDKDIANAKRFNVEWTTLQQKLEKTGYYVFNSLSPYIEQFTQYLTKLSDWVNQHPKEIHDAIKSIFSVLQEVGKEANKAVDFVGGWKNAILLLVGASVAGKLLSFMALLTGSLTGLSRIALPAWLLAAAGLSASNKIDEIHAQAKKEGKSVGEILIERQKETHKKGEEFTNKIISSFKTIMGDTADKITSALSEQIDLPYVGKTADPNEMNVSLLKGGQGQFKPATGQGKELLDMMSGEFGRLEGKYGLPVGLLRSVATTESGGNPNAKSKAGAEGLFQFMPGTAKDMGLNGSEVNDPSKSAEAAAKYLSQLLSQTGGDLNSALAAYNWGIGNVKKKGIENSPAETRNYVPKVLAGLRPGSGMAVANNPNPVSSGSSAPQYNIDNVTVNSPAQSVDKLTTDIVSRANNRVRVLAFNSGQ